MKNTNKAMRILAVVALVLCLFVLLGVTAFAADETTNIKDTDVAAIGNQGYATLQAAISAVKNDETIKLLADSNESVSISVKDKNITIDGNNKTYTGMISLSEGNGKTLTIKNATLMPTNVAFTVNVAKSSNWSVVVDTCTCVSTTDKWSTTKSYAIVYGTQTDNLSITIQNCPEITGFYYLAAFSQGGKSLTIDNCNDITDCVYLVSAGKCNVVTIKDVIYSGEAGMLMKGEGNAKTLNIEDSTITFTNETYPYNPVYISNSTSLVTAYVTGVNQFVDASGNAYEDLTWTNLPANKLNIEAQNGTKFGSLKAIAADAKPGDTVKLLADVTAENLGEVDVTGLTIDLGGKKITISDSNDLVFVGDNFTITNGTFETVNTYALWIGGDNAASNVTVENVTVNGGIEIRNANNVKITGENTVVTGKIEAVIAEGNNTVVSIYNGTYGNENEQHHVLAAGAGAKIYVYGGYFCCVVKEEYCAEGLVPTTTPDANGYYTVKTSAVAKVNGVEYSSLQAAIDAAPAGATVYLVADVTENNVTISDSIVIDGYKTADSNYTYTGSITIIVKNADVTINNVDFVKGNLVSDNSDGTEIELVGCNFDGQKAVQFATKAGHLEQLRITDCSIKNYTLGAVYISLQNSKNTIITDTVIDTMGAYAIAVVYGSAAELNGVTIKNTNGGLVAGTARDYILTDCVFENVRQPIAAWSGSVTGTFTFYGDNKAPNLYTNQGGTFVLATNATLIAPAGLDVTTDVTGGVVIYEDGKYSVKMGLAGSGTEADPYQIGSLNDLIMFRDSVNAGETKYNAEGVYVVLTANIDLAGIDWSVNIGDACNATFDGIFDGKGYTISNLTSTETTQMGDGYVCTGLFGAISGNAVIKNLTIDNANINTGTFTGNNAAAVVGFAWAATGTIENVKVTNSTINAVKIDGVGAIVGYAYGGNLTIANCEVTNTTVNGQSYVGGVIGYATAGALNGNTVTGTTVTANSAAAGGVAGIFYKGTTAANNTVKNTTITSNHDNWKNAAGVVVGSYVGNAVVSGTTAEDNNVTAIVGVLHAEKPTAPLAKTQAKIGDTYYATFKAAYDAAQNGDTITLLDDVTTSETITITKSITLDGNGKTITYTGSNRAIDVPNNATAKVNVTIKDLAVAFTGYSERGINYNDDGTLALENVIVNAEGKSVTYALNLPGSSDKATVVINNSALTGNIALNVWGENATITANNTVFTSVDYSTAENYSAVVLNNDGSTVANGTIVTINGGKIIAKDQNGDPSNAVRNATATGKVNVSENTEVVGAIVAPVAIVTYGGDQFYSCNTLQAAINKAIATNGNVELLADITASDIIVVNGSVVIDGNGYTLTSTAARAINVATDGNVTIKDLTINASGERAINVITSPANLTIDNVTATAANYTVNVAASAGAAKVAVKNSNLTGLNVVNVAGAGAVVTVADTTLTTVDNADEGYSMLALNKDAIGGKIEATNVTFVITGSNCGNTVKATNQAENGVITIDGKTDEVDVDVAYISYGNNWYGFTTLAAAIEFAKEGETVVLLRDITMDTMIVNTKKITLDLNGKTITGTDNTTKNFSLIDNRGELTITGNGKMTLKATVNSGWNRYSAVIANNPGGKLVVENGTIEHLGGTDMAYGIDNLTNGKGTYAETIINGGTIKSTYRAVRQFLNGVEAQNILTINGGTIEGANKAIFFHDPSKNANTGTLTVGANAVLNGDVYLFVTAGSTTWPVEVSIADSALNGEIVTGNVPEQYLVEKTNGTWNVNKYEAWLKNHGYVATLVEAIKIANERGISGGEYIYLLCDSEGPGFVTTTYIGIFFEGYTYTITSGVGSKGTESNGIQQLRGALVLRNGTLKVAESAADTMYILIQSYDKLTLTSMTVDGTNLDKWSKTDGDSYVISKNNGSLAINTVDIITNDDGDKAFAFDLCDQRDKGYMTLPSASTSANCTINGQPIAQMTDKIEAVAKYSVYYYATIEQAMAKHPSVTLIRNVEGPGIVIDKNVTIDFNGYTYTITSGVGSKGTESNGFQILAGNKVTLKNGTLTVAESAKHEIGILIQNYANLTISNMKLSDENLEKDEYPYVLSNNSGNVTLNSGTVITVNSANGVAFDAYAMKGYTAPVVEVYSSCKIPADKIEAVAKIDNKYYSTFEQAIEATKAGGTVNLLCDMKGPGVVIDKNITINFNGHTYAFTSGVGSNGTETNGFQILAGNTVTLKNGTLKVDGSAAGDMGILIQNYANLTIDNMELIGENLNKASYSYTLSVNSGNVTLKNGTIVSANTVGNGIAFDVYAMKGYELPVVTVNSSCKINGKIDAPARISTKYYATFAQAVEASYGNDVITLLGDVTTPGIVIDKRLTVDFAGKTLTFVGAAVGSTGTTTNGFQILAGNKVTLKNGTLEVAESAASNYAMLIQNYANLTLTDMVLDGTNLDYSAKTSYTLSINSGKVVIEGETKIIANDRNLTADYAFDVYDYSSAGYALPVLNDLSSGAFTWEGNTLAAAKIKFNDTTTTYYATLQQAVDACKSVTVVLLEDIVLKDTLVIANQTVKLDLAGYTISQEKACTESYAMIVNNGTLTINDTVGGGKISFKDTGAGDPNFTWGSYTIVNNKKLTVNAGTIENITELNTAAKNVHMYCAIQQNVATASTTISGGTISTPTYRSIRINQGKLSVSGGIIDGQIWVQPFAANCSVTVTGGTIGPNGGDASALFIENAKYAVTLKVSGGKFEGKIGCSKPDELVAKVTKCTFTTEAAKENTNAVLFSKTAKITVEEN